MSNPSQIFKIDAMLTFLWLIKHVYFVFTHPVVYWLVQDLVNYWFHLVNAVAKRVIVIL